MNLMELFVRKGRVQALKEVCDLLRHYNLVPIKKKRKKKKRDDRYKRMVREDLTNLYVNTDLRNAAFISRLNKGIPKQL